MVNLPEKREKTRIWPMLLYALLAMLFLAGTVVFAFWYLINFMNGGKIFIR